MGVVSAYRRGYTETDQQFTFFVDADSAGTLLGVVKLREAWHVSEWECVIESGGALELSVRTSTYTAWANGAGLAEVFPVSVSGGKGTARADVTIPAGQWVGFYCISTTAEGVVGLDFKLVAS